MKGKRCTEMSLEKIKLGFSPLSDSIFLYRHGARNENLALEKRNAEADVFSVLVEHMMYGFPNGSKKVITLGDKKYVISLTPYKEDD